MTKASRWAWIISTFAATGAGLVLAFLLSIAHELKRAGVFGNLDEFRDLMAVARKDVVLSEGWGEAQFRRMAALAGGDVEFRTLPVVRYASIDGQDVNIIDPAAIRAEIEAAIAGTDTTSQTPAAAVSPPQSAIVVVNASDVYGLASRTADVLTRQGYTVEEIRDRNDGETPDTSIGYGDGAEADAKALAATLGIDAASLANPTVAAGHVRVILGPDYQLPSTADDSTAPPVGDNSSTETSALPIPDAGGPVSSDGVPCVN